MTLISNRFNNHYVVYFFKNDCLEEICTVNLGNYINFKEK